VFIGNTFTERDIRHNYLETLLTIAYADRNVTFRNLGWSGDTVFIPSRAGSGPNKGIDLLVDYVKDLKPTVLVVAYGMNESFEGEAGLSRFVDGYNKLLDGLAVTKARLVLISPVAWGSGAAAARSGGHNRQLKMYSDAIRQILRRGANFVNLFDTFLAVKQIRKGHDRQWDSSEHRGYFLATMQILRQLDVS
jgi:hypothetical protein